MDKKLYYMDIMKKNMNKLSGKAFFQKEGLPLAVVPGGNHVADSEATFIPHCHDFEEIVFIVEGTGVQVIDGEEYMVQEGDVFVIRGDSGHYFRRSENLFLYNVLFDPDAVPLPLEQFRKMYAYRLIFETEPRARTQKTFQAHLHLNRNAMIHAENLVKRLSAALRLRDASRDAVALAYLIELIVFFSTHYSSAVPLEDSLPDITRILTWLETHYAEEITLASLSARAHTSPRNFLRQFRRVSPDSPVAYLLKLRLEKAADMLLRSNMNVGEIAEKTGFGDSNYFTRKFTERYRIPPREYRKTFRSL